jgi:hypothetical protein
MNHAVRFYVIIFAVLSASLAVAASLIAGATLGTLLAQRAANNAIPIAVEKVQAVRLIGASPYGVRVIVASPYGF